MTNFLPVQRKRKLELRQVVDAIFYILRTGCQWRNLPDKFPPWPAVYYYFWRWKENGCLENLNYALNKNDRKAQGKPEMPSLVCVDGSPLG